MDLTCIDFQNDLLSQNNLNVCLLYIKNTLQSNFHKTCHPVSLEKQFQMGCNQSSDGQWAYPVNGNGMSNGGIDVSFVAKTLMQLFIDFISSITLERKKYTLTNISILA